MNKPTYTALTEAEMAVIGQEQRQRAAESDAKSAERDKEQRRQERNARARQRRFERSPAGRALLASKVARIRAARRMERDAACGPSAKEFGQELLKYGASLYRVAKELERRGYRTPRGGLRWSAEQVKRELRRPDSGRLTDRLPTRKHRVMRRVRVRANEATTDSNSDLPKLTAKDRLTEAWADLVADLPATAVAPKEPLLDSRGRVLKGRRFSRIRRRPAPG